jgi:hypothetical protein
MRQRRIQYGIDRDGAVYSRVGDEVAFPVLDFAGMKPENGYRMTHNLEKDFIFTLATSGVVITWTRKIGKEIKNIHRAFWGFKKI